MTPRVQDHGNYFSADLEQYREINAQLLTALLQTLDQGNIRRSHFFNDRYENLYLQRARIPQLEPVLQFATQCAVSALDLAAERLACGFWINRMRSGEVTSRHSHDDNDELLSGVYYITVPKAAGDLVLHIPGGRPISVAPVAGRLLLFDPTVEHEVLAARFTGERISIGMHFGPA